MIKCTGTACTSTRVDKSTRENTETERGTGKGLTSGLQVKSNNWKRKRIREVESAAGLCRRVARRLRCHTTASCLLTGCNQIHNSSRLNQISHTKANGKTTNHTDKAPISIRMATPTLEVGSKKREKAKASTYMQMETQKKVSTKTIIQSVSTYSPTKTEERGRYNTPRVNSSTEEATKPAENSMIDNCLMRDCLQTLIYFSS